MCLCMHQKGGRWREIGVAFLCTYQYKTILLSRSFFLLSGRAHHQTPLITLQFPFPLQLWTISPENEFTFARDFVGHKQRVNALIAMDNTVVSASADKVRSMALQYAVSLAHVCFYPCPCL